MGEDGAKDAAKRLVHQAIVPEMVELLCVADAVFAAYHTRRTGEEPNQFDDKPSMGERLMLAQLMLGTSALGYQIGAAAGASPAQVARLPEHIVSAPARFYGLLKREKIPQAQFDRIGRLLTETQEGNDILKLMLFKAASGGGPKA